MNARGFTLLEVLIAMAILGVAVVASIQGFAAGLRLLKLAGDHQDAMLVADQKLREVVTPEENSRDEGTETQFRWSRTVERVPTPELSDLTRSVPWNVYRIEVYVRWDPSREIHLATLRTVSTLPSTLTQTSTPSTGQTATPGTGTPGTGPPGTTSPGQPGTAGGRTTSPPTTGRR